MFPHLAKCWRLHFLAPVEFGVSMWSAISTWAVLPPEVFDMYIRWIIKALIYNTDANMAWETSGGISENPDLRAIMMTGHERQSGILKVVTRRIALPRKYPCLMYCSTTERSIRVSWKIPLLPSSTPQIREWQRLNDLSIILPDAYTIIHHPETTIIPSLVIQTRLPITMHESTKHTGESRRLPKDTHDNFDVYIRKCAANMRWTYEWREIMIHEWSKN